ncbi:protein TIFY 6B-like isoform X2 [Vigna unguiculata]|uniref:Protein TIFY n=2 Tax=Vigna unguiculata TaxID=3917 RepID=A0A4D6LTG7_VIGUN|nr:protein TIFY 6B-like isoform X2 [Vigna unguiculata]QCD92319.1 CO/COL/TOC1 protein [Vigna unguiculata]
MQWSFPNKVSVLPQFLSFKTNQEDRPRKTILDPLASSGYMNMPSKEAFESNQKPFLGVPQRNLSIGKHSARNKQGRTVYPMQCIDAQSACLQEARIFSVSNQSNQVSPALQSNLATTGLNMVNSVIKPQPLGSKSSGTPLSVLPSIGSIVGSTDLRNSSKSSGMATQLTIFYAGSVCVYNDITPEKAMDIMLMAGNGSAPTQKMAVSTAKLQTPVSIPSKDDGFIMSQSYSPSPLPSPLSLTSHVNSQPGGGSSSYNKLAIIRPIVGPSIAPTNHLESPIIVGSGGSASKENAQPVYLPQARKASLARFLEKRKERMTSTSPYFYMSKKSSESSSSGSDSVSFSLNFSGSCSLPATN